MSLLDLGGEGLARADEILDRAAHDVAKYMAVTARNADLERMTDEVAGRVRSELCAVDGERPAWELWRRFAGELAALASDPEVEAVSAAMAELEGLAGDGEADTRAVARISVETARRITALRSAVRRRRLEQGR